MKGFIVYPTYEVKDSQAKVKIFGRLENGETFLSIHPTDPYFFIRQEDMEDARVIAEKFPFEVKAEKTELKNFNREPVSKITLTNPKNVPDIRDKLHDNEIPTYEADVRFVYRYFIDEEIRGSMEIEGDYEDDEEHDARVDRVYVDPDINPTSWTPNLKTLSFDIETDKEGEQLYSISLYTGEYENCLIKSEDEFENAESYPNELQLLKRFRELVLKLDPDIITGWNVIDFDLDFLEEKFKEYNLKFDLGRTDKKCTLRRYSSFMRDSTADFPGRQILDGIHLMRISFVRLEDHKLDTAAKEYLDEEKIIEGDDKYDQIEDAYQNDQDKLIKYNLKDAKLVYDILEESGVLPLTIQRSLITGMQLDRVKSSIASLDNLYLTELRNRGYVAPTRDYRSKGERITGGHVMESKPGIYDYVIVCDFASLYPSIMRTFNIDPLTYVQPSKEEEFSDLIEAPNGAKFRRESGIIPDLLQELWERRDEAKAKNNDLASYAIKVLMNSVFGVLANPNCRFYNFEMANAITHFGQHIIKLTAEKIREKGYDVIYGDTDSIFIDLDVDNYDKSQKIGLEIEEYINKFFKDHVREKHDLKSYIQMEFEKTYRKFFMPKTRGSQSGAKKRYAGVVTDGEEEDMEVVGLEIVRRDWTDLAKEFQKGLLKRIFAEEDPKEFVSEFVERLKDGKLDDLLVYRKALRKSPEDYVKTTPPHVKAARKMENIESNIIEYVQTVGGPEPVNSVEHTIDYDHYLEKQLKPIADQILQFYGLKFDDVLKGTHQTSLGGFA